MTEPNEPPLPGRLTEEEVNCWPPLRCFEDQPLSHPDWVIAIRLAHEWRVLHRSAVAAVEVLREIDEKCASHGGCLVCGSHPHSSGCRLAILTRAKAPPVFNRI